MTHPIIAQLNEEQTSQIKHPTIYTGDTVEVTLTTQDGGSRKRMQKFIGVVIARKSRSIGSSITVRKTNGDHSIERVFQLYSKQISQIKVTKRGDVRQKAIYYIRQLRGRAARIKTNLKRPLSG